LKDLLSKEQTFKSDGELAKSDGNNLESD